MLNKTVCPVCGSHDLRVKTFIKLDLAYGDAQGNIDKDTVNKESTTLMENESPLTRVYCSECYFELSKDVVLDAEFTNGDLLKVINERMTDLEEFRGNTLQAEFQLELAANDSENINRVKDSLELDRIRKSRV